jgi:hypothetical protein
MDDKFEQKLTNLKLIRDKFLRFHKLLLDNDRQLYEAQFGAVSSGKFLELLLSDEKFAWLRTISTLIVRIDEAFDLDDGISVEMLEGFYQESNDIFDEDSGEYLEFKERLNLVITKLPQVQQLKTEIIELLR